MSQSMDEHQLHRQAIQQHILNVKEYERQYSGKCSKVYKYIDNNWNTLCKQAVNGYNVSDLVADKFNIPYPVVKDWVQSISILKHMRDY